MGQGWKDYENAAEKGPLSFAIKLVFGCLLLSVLIGMIGYGLGWFGEAAQVTQQQFGATAVLKKYEWFKDAAAQLDKKRADVVVYESRLKGMDSSYLNVPRQKWARDDREQYNVWSSEVAGVKASYNSLAAEYNSAMAKMNWRFANAGDVPKGADPLPREFVPYITE